MTPDRVDHPRDRRSPHGDREGARGGDAISSLVEFRDLTQEEARELSWERTQRWLKNKSDVPPFSPSEARWHAREFISHNNKHNLVRLLAEAFLTLQDEAVKE